MTTRCSLWCITCHIGIGDDTSGVGRGQWLFSGFTFSASHARNSQNIELRLVRGVGRETSCFDDATCTCELMGGFHVSIM